MKDFSMIYGFTDPFLRIRSRIHNPLIDPFLRIRIRIQNPLMDPFLRIRSRIHNPLMDPFLRIWIRIQNPLMDPFLRIRSRIHNPLLPGLWAQAERPGGELREAHQGDLPGHEERHLRQTRSDIYLSIHLSSDNFLVFFMKNYL